MTSRLSEQVTPNTYDINLDIDLDNFKYNGKVCITCNVNVVTENIVLNSKGLVHNKISVFQNNKEQFKSFLVSNELLNIETEILEKGICYINIEFTGEITTQLEGFYRSKYVHDNIEKYMATTQFEAASARSAFPCFDEPNFKAVFNITIQGPKDKTILSNSSVLSVIECEKTKIVKFNPTPKMSTYLVAFIISDLEYVETETSNGTKIRVYATPGNNNELDFALDIAKRALEWYNKWFGIEYELPKMDLVAIPDFDAGAMENWGLITFREECLLCSKNTTLAEKQDIVNVICHEIAHQWFGNLVTMEWWTYLWLNESMATYFAWLLTDELFPEWEIWNRFIRDENARALNLDSLENSHPLEVPVNEVHEIQQIFDAISYSKGACLIRFLVDYIGMHNFQKGMREYITKYQYDNAVSDDLWNSFGPEINELMDCWTHQTGYPMLTVSVIKNIDKYECTISQTRYFKNNKTEDIPTKWNIPIQIRFDNHIQTVLLNSFTQTYSFDDIPIIINPNRCGFYRTLFTTPICYDKITNNEINCVLSDICCFSMSGHIQFSQIFPKLKEIVKYASSDYYFWTTLVSYINNIYDLLDFDTDLQEKFVENIIKPIYHNLENIYELLGWHNNEKETANDAFLRTLVINNLCRYGMGPLETAFSEFRNNNWMSKREEILPIVGRFCTIDDYKKMLEILESTHDQQLVSILIGSIAKATNKEMIEQNIKLIEDGKIRDHNLRYFINCLSYNPKSRIEIWNYVTSNWDKFLGLYPAGSSGLCGIVKVIASGFSTQEQLGMYENFLKIPPMGTEMSVNQTIENIKNRINIIFKIKEYPILI